MIERYVPAASTFAGDIDALFMLIFVLVGFWLFLCEGILFWLIFRFRKRDGVAPEYITKYVEWGAGPRASQNLVLGAKCLALLKGLPAPSCDEVKAVARPVLQHRIIPNYNATGEDLSSVDIVKWMLKHVPQPDYRS